MHPYPYHLEKVEAAIAGLPFYGKPDELYEPIRYILSLGGKRLRPVLVLMGNELFGGSPDDAMPAAMAVEVFHNFTLVHDDIMDKAPLRRGKPTVHHKWNETVAILSGDLMMIKATDLLCDSKTDNLHLMLKVFNATAMAVCEGQQEDMNFESRSDVSETEYLQMIAHKTAVLLGCALQLGAMTAGVPNEEAHRLYEFGKQIGIAFQIQDDILDAYGEGDKVGKQIGGDINANKKTLLLIEALKLADGPGREEIAAIIALPPSTEKVNRMMQVYQRLNVRKVAETHMDECIRLAFAHLEQIHAPEENKQVLKQLAINLMDRNN